MKNFPFFPRRNAPHYSLHRAAILLGGAALLAGCVSPTALSMKTVAPTDKETLGKLNANLAEESVKLAAAREEIRQLVENKAPQVIPDAIPPLHDPMENIVVSVKLQNATLNSILQVFSEQAKMNMLIDPEVLAIDKRASLYLHRVTARELYRHILEAFDLSGQVDGNTIKIGLFDERFFNIDFLNSRMSMDVTSGGNVFGSNAGGSGGSSSDQIRGNIAFSGGTGKQVETYDQLEANLKRLIGAKEGDGVQADKEEDKKHTVYGLNKNSGTLFVRTRPSQMRTIEKMVDRYKLVLSRQVLIEAQLLDVELNDQFQYGVDWSMLRHNAAGVIGGAPIAAAALSAALPNADNTLPARMLTFPSQSIGTAAGRSAGLGYSNNNVSVAINLLRGFGNVKILSNPSIRVRNNMPALLSVGSSNRYVVKSSVTTITSGTAPTTTADVQTDSVFSGVIIGVIPFIGERGNVELMINPMQTDVDAVSLQLQDVGGGNRVTLPKVNFKGMTTTLNIQDGDTVIIGGLIDQSSASKDGGIPGMSDIPMFGKLFDSKSTTHHSRELVIVLKVKLL